MLEFLLKLNTQMPMSVPASYRFNPAVFAAPIGPNTRSWAWDALSRRVIEILCCHHHQNSQFVLWNGG
jgi:hypothetical protein